jgi:polar amino acid transport system substrate-binding protein
MPQPDPRLPPPAISLPDRRRLCLSAALLGSAPAWALAPQAPAATAPRGLRILGLDLAPLIMNGPRGPGGVIVDIVQQVLADLGLQAQVEILPWARALQEMRAGSADGLIPAFRTPEREQWLDFPEQPVYRSPMAFFGRAQREFSWDGRLESVRRLRFVKLKDGLFADAFDEAVRQGRLRCEEASTFGAVMRMVDAGRADLACAPLLPGLQVLAQQGLSERLQPLSPAVDHKEGFLALARKPELAGLARKLGPRLAQLQRSGQVETWVEEYRQRRWAPRPNEPRRGGSPAGMPPHGPIWG